MRITKVGLHNYRGHKDIEIAFDPSFNLLVGINGCGKTSVLMAVASSFYGIGAYLSIPGVPPPIIDEDVRLERVEINNQFRFERRYPAKITSHYIYDEDSFSWKVSKDSAATHAGFAGNTIGQKLKFLMQDESAQKALSLPMFAFYRANRQWNNGSQNELAAVTEKLSRMHGYASYMNASIDGPGMERWVIAKSMERYQISSETGRRFEEIDDDELAVVNIALARALDEIKGVRYDVRERSILVDWSESLAEKKDPTLFANLSDGQRVIVGLVVDIARRMCLLNPHLGRDATSECKGVILIDELDVHLHPVWQRNLTVGLQRAFPAIQFIAASHSPQIIGELRPEQVIVMSKGGASHPIVSFGLDSSSVLEEIMGAVRRPLNVQDGLDRLFLLLEHGDLDEARDVLGVLRSLAPGISDLNKAEALLRRKEALGR